MATSEGTFGGNGSVNWKVYVDNPKNDTVKSQPQPKEGASRAWLQVGNDNTPDPGDGVDFEINIELPEPGPKRTAFLNEMAAAAAKPPGSGIVTLHLPIQREHWEQIRITWPTLPFESAQ